MGGSFFPISPPLFALRCVGNEDFWALGALSSFLLFVMEMMGFFYAVLTARPVFPVWYPASADRNPAILNAIAAVRGTV